MKEIKEEMLALLLEAKGILRQAPDHVSEAARGYWLAHIRTALDHDHHFLGGRYSTTMEDTIRECEGREDDE